MAELISIDSNRFNDDGVIESRLVNIPAADRGALRTALRYLYRDDGPTNLPRDRLLVAEQHLEGAERIVIRCLDAQGWYDFLRAEYFRWKYTAPNRYATTTRSLEQYADEPGGIELLHGIKHRLLEIDPTDIRAGLSAAREIKGLGTAGASGLLALMYPATFATVDQFVVKSLRDIGGLHEADALARMKPEGLTTAHGVILIGIMGRKAAENNRLFGTTGWTPRKIDQVLWTYGR